MPRNTLETARSHAHHPHNQNDRANSNQTGAFLEEASRRTRMALAERAATSGAATVDVADFIDQKPVGGFQIRILLMCFAVLFLDGYDTQALGYIAPALSQDWKLARGALGPVF